MDAPLAMFMAVFAPVILGVLLLGVPRSQLWLRVALALAAPIVSLIALGSLAAGGPLPIGPVGWEWMPDFHMNLRFRADQLGLFFALLIAGIGVAIVLYARAYFGPDRDALYRFYPSLLLFMTSMLGVVLADDTMALLLFWEMTSISSFLLIGWDRDDPVAVKKAMQAFIVTGVGGLALMAGLILLGLVTGAWTFTGLAALAQQGQLTASPLVAASFGLIFAGAAAKSAQWPLHFWLPGAMAAPTPVSAYLHSATMVKAGVYLVGRLWPVLAVLLPLWPKLIVPLGALTMLYAAFVALQKSDLKQIFAYTTVSQLGLLMCMYGLAAFEFHDQPNLVWDVTQIFNHALYKAPLFILAGAIGHVASRELPELRGFYHRGGTQKIMTIVLLLAAYAMAAGPLTLSFTAKEFFLYQIWHAYEATHNAWFHLLMAAAVGMAMFNVAIFIRLARVLLARPTVAEVHQAAAGDHHPDGSGHGDHGHETGIWAAMLWLPGLALVLLQYVGGIAPGVFDHLFGWLEPSRHYFDHLPSLAYAVSHPSVPLAMSGVGMLLGVGLGFAPVLRGPFADPHDAIYPGFYELATVGGGRVFTLVQTGNARHYVAFVALAIVAFFSWAVWRADLPLLSVQWPTIEPPRKLLAGYILAGMVCSTAILLPLVKARATRVLVLGSCGFSVTGVYYFYRAPDLALTQISIEIVSLILFLLVLSLLPAEKPIGVSARGPRLLLALSVGFVAAWITLAASNSSRLPMPYTTAEGQPIKHLGEFFLRNSYHAVDLADVDPQQIPPGVEIRTDVDHEPAADNEAAGVEAAASADGVALHPGGGGNNVVNVILVDFRGFDTMGEITVLGLAALGVWTLLRRRHQVDGSPVESRSAPASVREGGTHP